MCLKECKIGCRKRLCIIKRECFKPGFNKEGRKCKIIYGVWCTLQPLFVQSYQRSHSQSRMPHTKRSNLVATEILMLATLHVWPQTESAVLTS